MESSNLGKDRRGRDRVVHVVEFTSTSADHPLHEIEH